jgi:hypothetical protein
MKFYPLVHINSTWKYEIVIILNLGKKESIGDWSRAMIKQVQLHREEERERAGTRSGQEEKTSRQQ